MKKVYIFDTLKIQFQVYCSYFIYIVFVSESSGYSVESYEPPITNEGAMVPVNPPGQVTTTGPTPQSSNVQAVVPRRAPTMAKPKWHPPWKLYRVISGHLGWVRCVAVEPGNEWFATGSADRVIKVSIGMHLLC